MSDTFSFKLKSPLTEEQINLITDAEFEHTDCITFITPKGKEVEFRKVAMGKWIYQGCCTSSPTNELYRCDSCGKDFLYMANFCPNCGARMVNEDD